MTEMQASEADKTADYLESAGPSWLTEIATARTEQGRRVFVLYFNIRDLAFDPKHPPARPQDLLSVSDFLAYRLRERDLVLYYSLSTGVRVYKPQEQMVQRVFDKTTPEALWESVADDAARKPFPLTPRQEMPGENAPSHGWRNPCHVMPLLTRTFLNPYSTKLSTVANPTSSAAPRQRQPAQLLSVGLIIDSLDHLTPPPGVYTQHAVPEVVETLQRWSAEPAFDRHNHFVVMLTPDLASIHPELRGSDSRIVSVRVPRPDRDERCRFLSWLAQVHVDDPTPDERSDYEALQDPETVEWLANQTSGMNFNELLAFAKIMEPADRKEWERLLMMRRTEIIQRESGGLLVSKPSKFGLDDVAGYRYAREYVVNHLLRRLRRASADITGILFVGPPGTGKSFFAAALARDAGVNVVVMRSLRNQYVGQSERNLEQVLEVARSLAPVIIFIDEIDQQFSNRSGPAMDSGVEQRLLGRLLEFMDDKENLGRVIWVAASNRPDLIDAALVSRFRVKLPFLLPDLEACLDLLRNKLPGQVTYRAVGGGEGRYRWQDATWATDDYSLDELIPSEVVGKYSGRELETLVRKAIWNAEWDADCLVEGNEALLAAREADGVELESKHPITSEGGRRSIDARYLYRMVDQASVPHNQEEYLRQSLLALEWVEYNSPALAKAIQTALPPDIAPKILDGDRIKKDEIRRILRGLG